MSTSEKLTSADVAILELVARTAYLHWGRDHEYLVASMAGKILATIRELQQSGEAVKSVLYRADDSRAAHLVASEVFNQWREEMRAMQAERDNATRLRDEMAIRLATVNERVKSLETEAERKLSAIRATVTGNGGPIDADDTVNNIAYVMVRTDDFHKLVAVLTPAAAEAASKAGAP